LLGVEWDNNHKLGISHKEQIVAHPGIFLEGMRGTTKTLTCRVFGIDAEMWIGHFSNTRLQRYDTIKLSLQYY
jgi:hypothetical protein